jgi:predicted phage baseplate assembly protein
LSDRVVAEPTGKDDSIVSEVATVDDLSDESGTTVITLAVPPNKEYALSNVYELTSVSIYANIALATHGETVQETLGSGDGSQINQQFLLKKPPLTHISASTPSGRISALKVYVNDVQWREAATLYGAEPTDQSYIVRIEDNGDTLVRFGDGKTGSRLPSGSENVTATYRNGIGLEGAVGANKLTILTKRPFGIRSVNNPIAASGAAPPEQIEDARANAPSTVLTLDRIVSLKDYEDFARTFSGIAKANATAVWKMEDFMVNLIVAPADGTKLEITSTLYRNLQKAVDGVRAYGRKVSIISVDPVQFRVQGTVYVDPAYVPEKVKANAESALQDAFSFANRSFGVSVASSDVIAVIQRVPGVLYVDIDKLFLSDRGQIDLTDLRVNPEMLLTIDPKGISLEVKS